jgi:FKBP-type peptidyl-prolyl cis-trans isomerase FkpA
MHRSAKNSIVGVLCVAALLLAAAPNAFAADKAEDKKEDNVFYVLGVGLSQGLGTFALSKDELDQVMDGLKDGVQGKANDINPRDYMPQIQALQQEREAKVAAAEKKESADFLASAAKAKGAKSLDSGLIMTTVSEGSGASPIASDTVRVHYHGTLRDGTVFDSSVDRDAPATFPLDRVIPCWTEGVALMKVGGKSKLVCPSDIAYGDAGRPPMIPGGAALVFDVELLEIVKTP